MMIKFSVVGLSLAMCLPLTMTMTMSMASAAVVQDRIVDSAFSDTGPQGREIAIKNLDLMESETIDGSFRAVYRRLDVYVWVKGVTSAFSSDIQVLDKNAFGNAAPETAVLMGHDSSHPGYSVYRYPVSLGEAREPGISFCVDLYARYLNRYSNEGSPNRFLHYCH